MLWFLFIIYMGVTGRMSGGGFGAKYLPYSWIKELLFALPFGIACSWAVNLHFGYVPALFALLIGTAISYLGMRSSTKLLLQWEGHNGVLNRIPRLKPVVDWLAKHLGYKLGDEGYSWVSAALKGFIIGLPVGGVFSAVFFVLGHEIGSHARGRVDKWFDPHIVSEVLSGSGAATSIYIFVQLVNLVN